MECPEVSLLLSDYVDDALDPASRDRVDAHLASCTACAEELRSLQAYLETMAGMEKAGAPPGFLAAVHQRLDRPTRLQAIVRRLFYPWKVKLPMELAGIALATLILVFAYRTPELAKAPTPSILSSTTQRLELKSEKDEASPEMVAVGRPAARAKRVELTLVLSGPSLPKEAVMEQPAPAAPVPKGKLDAVEGIARDRSIRELPKTLDRASSTPMSASGRGASMTLHESERAYDRIKEALAGLGGVVLSADFDTNASELKTILVRLPAGGYYPFLEALGRLGRIRETLEENPETKETTENNEPMEVRIEIIPHP